jgi:hypothetical protein
MVENIQRECERIGAGSGRVACIVFGRPWSTIYLPVQATRSERACAVEHELFGHLALKTNGHEGWR